VQFVTDRSCIRPALAPVVGRSELPSPDAMTLQDLRELAGSQNTVKQL
jgi:hypothetical protein